MSKLAENASNLIDRLYPICRSITGPGVRETLSILREIIPIDLHEVPSGTKAFDWVIPNEWAIRDAYVKNMSGERIIDFQEHNLHLVNYSIPFEGTLTIEELKPHLFSLPDKPDSIPYCTSYYEEQWGFCLTDNKLRKLLAGEYGSTFEVKIDSTLAPGSLTYGDLIIPGRNKTEILLWCYVCHPSMANHELSGPVMTTYLAKNILERNGDHHHTYRFVFAPETIGAIVYASKHLERLQEYVIAGYVVACVGLNKEFSYLKSRFGNTLADRTVLHALEYSDVEYRVLVFLSRGSDERQFNAPGIDLPVGSLTRTRYTDFPEYHNSSDNLEFIDFEGIETSYEMYLKCIDILENNTCYRATRLGEPQLVRYGLRTSLAGKKALPKNEMQISNVLAYSDGATDLIQIAEHLGCAMWELVPVVGQLTEVGLLEES